MMVFNKNLLFQGLIFRFHVSFLGVYPYLSISTSWFFDQPPGAVPLRCCFRQDGGANEATGHCLEAQPGTTWGWEGDEI